MDCHSVSQRSRVSNIQFEPKIANLDTAHNRCQLLCKPDISHNEINASLNQRIVMFETRPRRRRYSLVMTLGELFHDATLLRGDETPHKNTYNQGISSVKRLPITNPIPAV